MKNIKCSDIENLKTMVAEYNHYKLLYAMTKHMFKNYPQIKIDDVLLTINKHIMDELNGIDECLNELYDNWSGVTQYKNNFYMNHNSNNWSEGDINTIRAPYEKEGMCIYLNGINSHVIIYIPVYFMKKFIEEYGIFVIDNHNNIEIID